MIRTQIAAANWKMNLTLSQAEKLTDDILELPISPEQHHAYVFGVPFPYLIPISLKLATKQHFHVAAQNMAATKNGAFTGEVSAEMLQSIGIQYVIIGHSERREYYLETNDILKKKIDLAFEYGIKPIFCCGESLSTREAGTQNQFVETQLRESLFHLADSQMRHFIIAYEPIWAIGTGKTASSEQAQEMHQHIRDVLAGQFGKATADTISILYGGSVKAGNATEIFGKSDVDGGLVGGASLIADEFNNIMKSLKSIAL